MQKRFNRQLTEAGERVVWLIKALTICLSPYGMLGLQAEQEALSEGLDIVDTMKVILRHVHRKVAYIKQFKTKDNVHQSTWRPPRQLIDN